VPQISVAFDIDANGILSVSATDKATNKQKSIKIESMNLSEDEIKAMKEDAEKHAAEDAKIKEEIDLKNNIDSMIYTAEKSMEDNKDKLPEDFKKELETKLNALKEVRNKPDATKEELQSKYDELSSLISKMYEQVKNAGGENQQNSSSENPGEGKDPSGAEQPQEPETK